MKDRVQISLTTDELPEKWYNVLPDLPEPLPQPKDPAEGPSRLELLPKAILRNCLEQDSSSQRWIPVPEEIRDLYLQAGRPRPLHRALRLERKLNTKSKLYYKGEDLSPTGSHKGFSA